MDKCHQLEHFRREWKEELLRQKTLAVPGTAAQSKYADGGCSLMKRISNTSESCSDSKRKRDTSYKSDCSSSVENDQKCNKLETNILKRESFLDIFLSDLNEITVIPFFDLNLPREVAIKIFHHLDAKDLCRCAQVSKAWKSLAEDEHLWCCICHKIGYEENTYTAERQNWKDIVKTATTIDRSVKYNWKNRSGGIEHMSHVQGGIVTAVDCCNDWLVAGYTSLDVKLWNLDTESSCIFTPSSKALVPQEDASFVQNYVKTVCVNQRHAFALYETGTIDIWENESHSVCPVHNVTGLPQGRCTLHCSQEQPIVGVSYDCFIKVISERSETESSAFVLGDDENTEGLGEQVSVWKEVDVQRYGEGSISEFLLIPRNSIESPDASSHIVVAAIDDKVKIHTPTQGSEDMTDLYHTAFHPAVHIDYRQEELALVVAIQPYSMHLSSLSIWTNQVQVYNLESQKAVVEFSPQRENIDVININESPPQMLVSAGVNRIHVYDIRVPDPVVEIKSDCFFTKVQMDDWKIVSGDSNGYVCVWDQRMATKFWDMHNRHPVQYVNFKKNLLITANIPADRSPWYDEGRYEGMLHSRHRGNLSVYDFSVSQQREDLPTICQSTFDEPERYNYNIRLTMPYDSL